MNYKHVFSVNEHTYQCHSLRSRLACSLKLPEDTVLPPVSRDLVIYINIRPLLALFHRELGSTSNGIRARYAQGQYSAGSRRQDIVFASMSKFSFLFDIPCTQSPYLMNVNQ